MAITKIDITMLEDVGGANNLVKLDANAKIPAAAGVSLLNVPGPFTSTSDPAINSNKTLGFEWVNSTSGGDACGVPFNNWIQKYSYTSDGNASDVGNLTESKFSVTAAHY